MVHLIGYKIISVRNWWAYLVLGIALIALSVLVLSTPEESFLKLTSVFSLYAFINGSINITFAIMSRRLLEGWGWHFAYGCLEIIVGLLLLFYPVINITIISFILGFWLLFNATFLMGTAFELKKYGYKYGAVSWSLMLYFSFTLAALAFAVLMHPKIGQMTMIGWLSLSLMALGLANVVLAYRLRFIRRYEMNRMDRERTFFYERLEKLKQDLKAFDRNEELEYRLDVFIAELENRVMKD